MHKTVLLQCVHQKCHSEHTKLLKLRHVVNGIPHPSPLGAAGLGTNRTKIKVSGGESLLQKSARESGKVAEIEIF